MPWVRYRLTKSRVDALEPGVQLSDDLTALEYLGGNAKVDLYLCKGRWLRRSVACKVLRPEYRVDFSVLKAMLKEGQALLQLDNPHLVKWYAVEVSGGPRIVMDYIPGETLKTIFFTGNYETFALEIS